MFGEKPSSKLAHRLLYAAFRGTRDEKELHRQLEDSAGKLARRLGKFERSEFGELPKNEKTAASLAVCAAVENLGIAKEDFTGSDVNEDGIYALLLPAAEKEWQSAYLSEAGEQYGKKFLREVSRFLVATAPGLPDL